MQQLFGMLLDFLLFIKWHLTLKNQYNVRTVQDTS